MFPCASQHFVSAYILLSPCAWFFLNPFRWALGILIFEMLAGFPPFFDENPYGIYQKILAGRIDFPK